MKEMTNIKKIEFGTKAYEKPHSMGGLCSKNDNNGGYIIQISIQCGESVPQHRIINVEKQRKRELYRKLNEMTGIE